MPISRRRRVAVVLVVGLSLIVGVAVGIVAAGADTERIEGYWAGAVLTEEGLLVTEVIDYDFGPNPRRGIFRHIPDLIPGSVTASSPTAPDQFTVTDRFVDTEVRIGDPAVTITGRHRYRIDYTLAVDAVLQDGLFSWDAIGTEWPVPISDVEVRLVVAGDLELPGCQHGTPWDSDPCGIEAIGDGRFASSVGELAPGEAVTVSGRLAADGDPIEVFPVPPSGPAEDPGTGFVRPALVAVVAALLGGAVATVANRRAGRERVWRGGAADAAFGDGGDRLGSERLDEKQLAALATIEFEPPRDTSAVEGGLLLQEHVRDEHLAAWLLESSIRGEIELEDDDDPTIRWGSAPAHPVVHQILDAMFDGRGSITLDEYDADFSAGWSRLRNELGDWLHGSAHWDDEGRRRRTRVRLLSILGLIVALLVAGGSTVFAAREGGQFLPFVAFGALGVGAALGALVTSFELLVRTETGSAMWLRIESFRRFLENSEARHVDDAAERGVLRHYTAWAVALGESRAWSKAVDAAAAADPALRSSLHRDLAFVHIGSRISSASQTASTKPSSSSGGGFSGGAGGGGGGGGGGSW